MPPLTAFIRGRTILDGVTLLKRIPIRLKILTFTFAARAEIHNPTGTKLKNSAKNSTMALIIIIKPIESIIQSPFK
jgi:hypothetical protein